MIRGIWSRAAARSNTQSRTTIGAAARKVRNFQYNLRHIFTTLLQYLQVNRHLRVAHGGIGAKAPRCRAPKVVTDTTINMAHAIHHAKHINTHRQFSDATYPL